MRFIRVEGGWQLVDEGAAEGARVIAFLKSEVEAAALLSFCEQYLADPRRVPEHFTVAHEGQWYTVTPLGGPGEPLTLLVGREGGVPARITTTFVLASPPE